MDQLIAEKEFTTLERDFLSCRNLSSTNDTWLFSLNLANIFDSIVQYNDEGSGFSIASVCQYMTPSHLTPYENLVQFVQVRKDGELGDADSNEADSRGMIMGVVTKKILVDNANNNVDDGLIVNDGCGSGRIASEVNRDL